MFKTATTVERIGTICNRYVCVFKVFCIVGRKGKLKILLNMLSTASPLSDSMQLTVKSNPGLLCFCFSFWCDWFRKLAPLSQVLRFKTETIAIQSLAFFYVKGSCLF